jgi:imidazoleglycerol-phosphate dehydratase
MTEFSGMSVAEEGEALVVTRETREARIRVALDLGPPREGRPATTLAFFDHMLEMLGWYLDAAVDATYEPKTFRLTHVVCEDVGLALGAAAAAAVRARVPRGVESSGFALGVMDEAYAQSHVSFEGRSLAVVERGDAAGNEHVEDMLAADLAAFFEGFAQGGRCTVHLRMRDARDPHHAWEAGFRAFARALRDALASNPRRTGRTAGVKGTLD